MGQFHHDLVHMRDLPLVHPVLHLSILDAGILIMVSKFDDVLLEHGELPHVLPHAVHLQPELFWQASRGDHSKVQDLRHAPG